MNSVISTGLSLVGGELSDRSPELQRFLIDCKLSDLYGSNLQLHGVSEVAM